MAERAKFSAEQIANWTKRVSLDLTLAHILTKKEFINSSLKVIQEAIQQLHQELANLIKLIQEINQTIEVFKKQIILIKNYEGIFLNSLCKLHTVPYQECPNFTTIK